MDEYHPCKKPDQTAQEAIGNVMRLVRVQNRKKNKYNARKKLFLHMMCETDIIFREVQ